MLMLAVAALLQATVPTAPQTGGGPATAAGAPAPTAPAAKPATPVGKKVAQQDWNKMVCKDQTPIGSRIPGHKICRTVAEWDAQRTDARFRTEQSQAAKDLGRDN